MKEEIVILRVKNKAIQELIERAEYDLLCAIYLSRHGAFGTPSPENVIYLLHQSIEKWLKVVIHTQQKNLPKKDQIHDLEKLLGKTESYHACFSHIWQLLIEGNKFLDEKYGKNIRYQSYDNAENDIYLWIDAAFTTRRIAKRWLKFKMRRLNDRTLV